MNHTMQEGRFLGGLLTGVVGTILTWQFGAAVVTSGWTSTACAAGLVTAAGAVAATRWLDRGVDPVLLDPSAGPAPFVSDAINKQSDRPRDWLRKAGAASVPENELAGFLRARLSADLHGDVERLTSVFKLDNSAATTALIVALAARSLDKKSNEDGIGLMRLLARYNDLAEGPDKSRLLNEITVRIGNLHARADVTGLFGRMQARHAMTETLALGLLDAARRNGPVASNEFGWLKRHDRGLWYALDNLGRRAFHVEGLAAMDHYAHEVAAGTRLATPQVANATSALTRILEAMRVDGGLEGDRTEADPWVHEDDIDVDEDEDNVDLDLERDPEPGRVPFEAPHP